MKLIAKNGNSYTLRLDYGEDFLAELKKFLVKNKVKGGWLTGLGALINPEIAYYDLDKEKYLTKKFKGKFEVLNLTGNAARFNTDVILHIHIILGKKNFSTAGGHLMGGKVGGTLEVFLNMGQILRREREKNTGLNILC